MPVLKKLEPIVTRAFAHLESLVAQNRHGTFKYEYHTVQRGHIIIQMTPCSPYVDIPVSRTLSPTATYIFAQIMNHAIAQYTRDNFKYYCQMVH